ncbi:MAG: pyridoxamine 5'-phosphate oxidase family protein [Bacteroidetes bacterium]|nr:pyridoxamine 5'-phosphate oxidase family protein [Bacteroidota bacterium]
MERTRVKRSPNRGHYDDETIRAILKNNYLCHVAFNHQNAPVNIPTLYGLLGDYIYFHGATTSRLITNLESGIDVCVAITQVDGLVLARSAFHHSMNYQSVVVFGKAKPVSGDLKLEALKAISDQIIPGRWKEVRAPNAKEMKATTVLQLPLTEASAKIRTGPPSDDKADYDLPIWAGVVNTPKVYGEVETDPGSKVELPISKSVQSLVK